MVIDAHQHLWRIGQNGHEWPTPDLDAIYRDFGAHDLNAVAEASGVTGTVLVQSQPSARDTEWMLRIAEATPLILGVVGWVDLAAGDAVTRLGHMARQPKLKGIRPMLQGLADDEWILRPDVQPALKAMLDLGLRFDALIFPRHLRVIDQLAKLYPDLPIVIDHCAKPPIARDDAAATAAWKDDMTRVAQNPNVFCKLSGLITEAATDHTLSAVKTYADHAIAAFGSSRLMWGSDWPVVELRTAYASWLDWVKAWLAASPQMDSPHVDRKAILGDTARSFYQLT